MTQGVLELHELDEEVVLGIEAGSGHRRLEIKAEPFLDAAATQFWGALCEVEEEHQVEHERRGEDGIAAEKIHLDLHGIAEPAEDINVVPTLFIITTRRVIVDAYLVIEIAVQMRVKLGLENLVKDAELGFLLGLEGIGIFEHLAVAIAKNIGGVPAAESQ